MTLPVNVFVVIIDRVTIVRCNGEAPRLLVRMPDASITLLGDLFGHPPCRTRRAACARGVGGHADRHP
jgi:hypothetical protein